MHAGRFQEARDFSRAALTEAETTAGPDSLAVADAIDLVFRAESWGEGRAGSAELGALVERGLAIRIRLLGPEDPVLGNSLEPLSVVRLSRGDLQGAREAAHRSLELCEEYLGPDSARTSSARVSLAVVLNALGEYAESRSLYERAVEAEESRGESANPARLGSWMQLEANPVIQMGDYAAAEALIRRAEEQTIRSVGEEHPDFARVLDRAGSLRLAEGRLTDARDDYERALAIRRKTLRPGHPRFAETLVGLANLCVVLGDSDRARALYGEALGIAEREHGPVHRSIRDCYAGLAEIELQAGDLPAAKRDGEKALEVGEAALGAEHPNVARSLALLARVEAQLGETDAALDLALRAEATGLRHLRLTCRGFGEDAALRAAAVRPTGLDLALSLAARGGAPASEVRRAWDAGIRSRNAVFDLVAARHRALAEDPVTGTARQHVQAAAARLAALALRGPQGLSPEDYHALLDEARAEEDRAERELASASPAFRVEESQSALGLDEVGAALPPGSALVGFFRFRSERTGSERRPGTSGADRYLAFVLRSGADPVVVPLSPADDVDRLVSVWRSAVGTGANEARSRTAGAALRKRVWDPVAPQLAGAGRVFLVPDGALNLVNFAALPEGRSAYLVESAPLLHVLLAERDLAAGEAASPPGEGLLAIGGPAYGEPPAPSARPRGAAGGSALHRKGAKEPGGAAPCGAGTLRFDPLPGAEREAREVASLWNRTRNGDRDTRDTSGKSVPAPVSPATVLYGAGATETAFESLAPGREVLHVATHAFVLGGPCAATLAGTPGGIVLQEEGPVRSGGSPLLWSGLAFAGANGRRSPSAAAQPAAAPNAGEADGILTAAEAATLDLSRVRWAVLSGCDTGLGEIRAGEGVLGLRRAFQIAGVRTVILSLWPVDDRSGRIWMKKLYEARLQDGLPAAEAVRVASRAVLRERREAGRSTDPFFWAPFVAAGDWR